MKPRLLRASTFGPWALVTGASAGIGQEFARQLAAHGLNLVLTSRRLFELESVGQDLARQSRIEYRAVQADLTRDDAMRKLEAATADLDIGLVISNAGDAMPGQFLAADPEQLHAIVRLNVLANLDLARHFGVRLAARQRGGLILVGALGASNGVPFMANPAATKAYVHSLGQALHVELGTRGVNVTVLMPGPTDTPALHRLGIKNPPMKPMRVERCVSEALRALDANRATVVPGRLIRWIYALIPASVARNQTARMFELALSSSDASQEKPR